MKSLIESLPLPEVYYHDESTSYYRAGENKRWIKITGGDALKFLVGEGYARSSKTDQSEADECLLKIQSSQEVAYVGPLAGYSAGRYTFNEKTVLVNSSPKIVTPAKGEWPTIKSTIEAILKLEEAGHENDQLECFYGWLAAGYRAVSKSQWSSGQALVMAGPVNAGKSLLQMLITKVLGGREAKPYQFMTGDTTFNRDLFEGEHLMIEDDSESTNIGDRKEFGASLKSIAVNRGHRCHGKNKDGVNLSPIWRMSVSVNDTPERIKVLPPLEEDISDKVILLKAHRRDLPMPTCTEEDKTKLREAIDHELPAFLDYLMNVEIDRTKPDPLKTVDRFGVFTYQNQDIARLLANSSPEAQMLGLIDRGIFSSSHDNWTGEAWMLHERLTEGSMVANEAKGLLKSSNITGQYLGRLASNSLFANRVSKRVLNGNNIWTITPPPHRRRPATTTAAPDATTES